MSSPPRYSPAAELLRALRRATTKLQNTAHAMRQRPDVLTAEDMVGLGRSWFEHPSDASTFGGLDIVFRNGDLLRSSFDAARHQTTWRLGAYVEYVHSERQRAEWWSDEIETPSMAGLHAAIAATADSIASTCLGATQVGDSLVPDPRAQWATPSSRLGAAREVQLSPRVVAESESAADFVKATGLLHGALDRLRRRASDAGLVAGPPPSLDPSDLATRARLGARFRAEHAGGLTLVAGWHLDWASAPWRVGWEVGWSTDGEVAKPSAARIQPIADLGEYVGIVGDMASSLVEVSLARPRV